MKNIARILTDSADELEAGAPPVLIALRLRNLAAATGRPRNLELVHLTNTTTMSKEKLTT